METPAFVLLTTTCMGAMLGLRFGLAAVLGDVAATLTPEATSSEASLALPPKPEGADSLSEQLGEDGTGQGLGLLTREGCLSRSDSLLDVCFHALARQGAARDPRASLGVCAEIRDPDLQLECRSDVAEATATVDRAVSESICKDIASTKWRGQCNFGIGLALAETDSAYALARCEAAEVYRDFCRHDVVGEVALVNLPAAHAFCAREEGDTLTRKTCWHGIGKYLARRDFGEAAAACLAGTPQWIGNCFHGVGWGASERDPDGALARCDQQDPYRDNCRQGVAHQLKRSDPSRAVSVCESIVDAGVRGRCLAFVTR